MAAPSSAHESASGRGELPTERSLPASEGLDTFSTDQIVRLMAEQDAVAVAAVAAERVRVVRAVDLIVPRLRAGGRLFYVGAGTSGRLGVLDAAECPPTFRTRSDTVQAILAGGPAAVFEAQEGAEDDADAGAEAVRRRSVGSKDIVFGIAAGGTTPFVHGALRTAHDAGAATVLLACVPPTPNEATTDVRIAPVVGPEVLTGSTRLKAGTATKLVLNQVSTTVMVRLGKTYGNRMVDLRASNAKLRDRAARLVVELGNVDRPTAERLLDQADGEAKTAILMARAGSEAIAARVRLAACGGSLREALRECAE